ncbi:MAG: RecQ family ATP-dependent DNA helicase [Patescibacteria group bacterium]|jgi:ATP-dependent DNA helicase RecQ
MLEQYLEKYFNFSNFRQGQKEIVESILARKDVLALMPTGGGKSLCYQLPAILSDKLTVIISPLIALMKDQVDALKARGIEAVFINSSLSFEEIEARMAEIKMKKIKILYIAPERLSQKNFIEFLKTLDIFLLAIDEAHCVSAWGHDFRPDYMLIKNCIKELKNRPIVGAFTATATPEVKQDIIKRLELQDPKIFTAGFNRQNLKFFVQANLKAGQRPNEVLRIVKSLQGSGIVYTLTRKEAEETAAFLCENNIKATFYHAGMQPLQRSQMQNDFMENKFKVIVATIAFGMGVDKADVRFVIHMGMPASLEGYYQEAGRAGRDSENAYCILLHSKKDVGLHNYFIQKDKEEMQRLGKNYAEISQVIDVKYRQLEKMVEYVENNKCRRKMILEYFADLDLNKINNNCQGCDVCFNFKWQNTLANLDMDVLQDKNSKHSGSDTVLQTIKLYQQKHTLEQIAKIRSLGVRTIFNHLIKWYKSGGDLEIEKFITKQEEQQILQAMAKASDYQRLRPIKDQLPESVSYEKICCVIAKIQRIDLK